MKKRTIVILPLLMCMLLSACGGEVRRGYVFSALVENIKVEVTTEGGYDMKASGSVFTVTKDKKEVLQGWIVFSDEWDKAANLVSSGNIEVLEKTSERIVWKDGDKYNTITQVSISYVYTTATISSTNTEEVIRGALDKMHYEVTDERAFDSLDDD